jgi:4,5:9,10-diseco-3-hydroxy-5,9,17-trioxoandrosta-1(10),2-diene-4-oate hydrolase
MKMEMPVDQYIKVGALQTRFWAEGNNGHPVVLIHGLGGYVESWALSINSLANNYRVYALDLPGHGRTDKPLDVTYDIESLAQFVIEFMAAIEVENAHLVGHSLGGAIATRMTLLNPALLGKLILVASGGLGREVSLYLRIPSIPILGEILTKPSRSGSADAAKTLVYDLASMPPESIELNYQMASQPNAQQAFLKTVRANGNIFGQKRSMYGPNVKGLETIKNSALIIWGRQDQIVPVEHAEVADKGLPNSHLRIFDACGHIPMIEHPETFNELLLDFLSDKILITPNPT